MTLMIDYPPLLPDSMQMSQQEFEKEARLALAVKLFEMKNSPQVWRPNLQDSTG